MGIREERAFDVGQFAPLDAGGELPGNVLRQTVGFAEAVATNFEGQGVAQGAQLTQMPQGGWAWVVKELPAAA